MKTKLQKWMVLPALALAAVVAWGADRVIRTSLLLDSPYDRPALRIQLPAGLSTNAVEIRSGETILFAIPSTGIIPLPYGGTGSDNADEWIAALNLPGLSTNATPAIWRGALGISELSTNASAADLRGALALNEVVTNATAFAFKRSLGIIAGTITPTADGLQTNIYAQALGANPRVVLTATSAVPAGSNQVRVVSSTTDGFVVFGHTNVVYNWISVL